MLRYSLAIFSGALLLFLVQPMIGKFILPWFGGGSGVWNACMVFFQTALLAGYLYAHLLGKLAVRAQVWLHSSLLAASLAVLPITPDPRWKPDPGGWPIGQIVLLLAAHVGLPYLLLATTGPLMQRWFHLSFPGRSPYRLYALSNLGSLLALVLYPLVVEVAAGLVLQTRLWSGLYAGYVVLGLACGALLRRPGTAAADWADEAPAARPPSWADGLLWLALAACGSALLLATTNLLCIDVAVVPFLWVLPLGLYLLTFILCFESDRWYRRPVMIPLLLAAVLGQAFVLVRGSDASLLVQVGMLCGTLLAGCMTCHGELARLRPAPRYLTLFYLFLAAGGAAGGLFVALAAPLLFRGLWEFHAALLLAAALAVALAAPRCRDWLLRLAKPRTRGGRRAVTAAVAAGGGLVLSGLGYALWRDIAGELAHVTRSERNFHGVVRIRETLEENPGGPVRVRSLLNGRINHGLQIEGSQRNTATTYFGSQSGIALALARHPLRRQNRPLRIGIVGLGTGTIASWARPGDALRIYEIDPKVIALSEQGIFTFVEDARRRGAAVELLLGDARIVLERELLDRDAPQFDLLAVDAFSSDAIPVHLLTRQCHDLYWRHLEPHGVLAFHVTNRFINLEPVVRGLAEASGRRSVLVQDEVQGRRQDFTIASTWVLVAGNPAFLADPVVQDQDDGLFRHRPPAVLWTDDFSTIYRLLQIRR